MNLPNKLTILRVILIPFFIFFLLTDCVGAAGKWIALAIFCIASLTDLLDGKIARKYNLVTNFGKFMDPLADKLLVCSALICYVGLFVLPSWFVIVIIAREFIISGFRLIASDNGVVIAASWWGKIKTVLQMFMTIYLMVLLGTGAEIGWDGLIVKAYYFNESDCIYTIPVLNIIAEVLCLGAVIMTVVSLIDYILKNKDVMKDQK